MKKRRKFVHQRLKVRKLNYSFAVIKYTFSGKRKNWYRLSNEQENEIIIFYDGRRSRNVIGIPQVTSKPSQNEYLKLKHRVERSSHIVRILSER